MKGPAEKKITQWKCTVGKLNYELKKAHYDLEDRLSVPVKLYEKVDLGESQDEDCFEFQTLVKSQFRCSRSRNKPHTWSSHLATLVFYFKLLKPSDSSAYLSILFRIVEYGQSCALCSRKENRYEKICMTNYSLNKLIKQFIMYVEKAYFDKWNLKTPSLYHSPDLNVKNHVKWLCEACDAGICPALDQQHDCSQNRYSEEKQNTSSERSDYFSEEENQDQNSWGRESISDNN